MSLCFVINNLGQGGAERQLLELIKNLDKTRFKITLYLYAVNKGVFFKEIFRIPQITIVENRLKNRFAPLKIMEALFYIRRVLKTHPYDIVHTMLFMNGLFVRMVAPRGYEDRIISSMRSSLKAYPKYQLFAEKLLIRRSYVVANTRTTADDLIKIFPAPCSERVKWIYNGYDTHRFFPRKAGEKSDRITVGCIGRITRTKNYLQVVRALHRLQHSSARLLIVGRSGDQEQAIRAYVTENRLEERVTMKPEQDDIEDLYNHVDIIVIPSLAEGCPNVLFEAMLCKCFCIISINANTDEFVVHGENGLVYDGTDGGLEEQLKFAISILHTKQFDRIRENGRCYAYENFSMERMVRSYERLYGEIVNRHKSGRKGYISTDVS